MAQNKKSFILYSDMQYTVDKLPDEKAGELFKLILSYVNDENPDIYSLDLVISIAFEPIKQQLKRDLNKWDDKREKRAEAGRLGGLAKASNAKQKLANLAVNVNVNDNVNVNVIKNKEIPTYKIFKTYALSKKENVHLESLRLKYEAWVENDWKDGNDKNIKNWKSKLLQTLKYLGDEKTKSNNRNSFESDTTKGAIEGAISRIRGER